MGILIKNIGSNEYQAAKLTSQRIVVSEESIQIGRINDMGCNRAVNMRDW